VALLEGLFEQPQEFEIVPGPFLFRDC